MKHLGDVTKIIGHDAPVVDVVIGGSPCQDLSVAGKRAGLAGERSGLYMEQIRIIKEMREHDNLSGRTGVDVRPRYMVWENVPGAFSSNGGKDFAAVIEEAIRIAEPEAPDVPVPQKGWPTSGVLFDESGRWSVAWRVLDAQFWGVPQRRRRIALIADFGGLSASEILFVREGMRGHLEESQPQRKEAAGDVGEGTGGSNIQCVVFNGANITSPINKTNPRPGDPCHTLANDSRNWMVQPVFGIDQQGGTAVAQVIAFSQNQRDEVRDLGEKAGALQAQPGMKQQTFIVGTREGSGGSNNSRNWLVQPATFAEVASTLRAGAGAPKHEQDFVGRLVLGAVMEPDVCVPINDKATRWKGGGKTRNHDGSGNGLGVGQDGDPSPTLTAGDRHAVACLASGNECTGTLMASMATKQCLGDQEAFSGDYHIVEPNYIVRRLTPLECERLQGFPDGWTDIGEWVDSKGKRHKDADSPRYKALGNSIAIPPWKWVLKRLCACYERDATMASMFDGIGGFPYIWEQLNGKGSCLWASEIEEFPMAVTKLRFGGNENA